MPRLARYESSQESTPARLDRPDSPAAFLESGRGI
jgi:hypothetical protein